MLVLGTWSDPLPLGTTGGIQAFQRVIERYEHKCLYCGMTTRLTPQTPLGHFNICLKDRTLPNEPSSWIPLCEMCSDLNDMNNLKGKGTFIEANWVTQGRLNSLLRVAYSVAVNPEHNWGVLKDASDRFLAAIDSTPAEWGEVEWDGTVVGLQKALDGFVYPVERNAYANKLRFRFDLEPYEAAIRFWAAAIGPLAENILSTGSGKSKQESQ